MDDKDKKIAATLLQPREGAGKYWWEMFLRGHISDINRRFNQAKALYITDPDKAPVDLFSYIREAALCFEIGRYVPAIVLASVSVTAVFKRDLRMRSDKSLARYEGTGIALCIRNLVIARDLGLPTEALLSDNERLDADTPIIFIERNERIIRGEVSEWFRGISDYLPSVEHQALDQLEKAQRFLVAWFNASWEGTLDAR